MIDGRTLIGWGFKSGAWFPKAIEMAREFEKSGWDENSIRGFVKDMEPVHAEMRDSGMMPYHVFLDPENDAERDNLASVQAHMRELLRVPTILAGAVMPDACPAGHQPGTIPVGGVVATKDAIHPGFHSADICCSMFMTVLNKGQDPKAILDMAMKVTHFGPGGRPDMYMSNILEAKFKDNFFLKDLVDVGHHALGTQGDGNHFFYVGHLKSTGHPVIVTHHGSRNVGAQLYKKGMAVAKKHTALVAPRIPAHNAWIDAESLDGRAYWAALQIIREWTRSNHRVIHNTIVQELGAKVEHQMWNEHNFVFRRSDGLYYHGKGATPSFKGFSDDDSGQTLIPLNMSEPILIAEPKDRPDALGFAPHGAGRNMSRTGYMKELMTLYGDPRGLSPNAKAEIFANQTKGLDIRAFSGFQDLSELPGAYKNADAVRSQIEKYGLANIVDEVLPYGSIMAGEQVWDRKRAERKA